MSCIAYLFNKRSITRAGTIMIKWDSQLSSKVRVSTLTVNHSHGPSVKDAPGTSAGSYLYASHQPIRIDGYSSSSAVAPPDRCARKSNRAAKLDEETPTEQQSRGERVPKRLRKSLVLNPHHTQEGE